MIADLLTAGEPRSEYPVGTGRWIELLGEGAIEEIETVLRMHLWRAGCVVHGSLSASANQEARSLPYGAARLPAFRCNRV